MSTNEMQIFENCQDPQIKEFEAWAKQKDHYYFEYIYAIEFGDKIKIGKTKRPYTRFHTFKHEGEYHNTEIGRVALSKPHTNYSKNETSLHQLFSQYRVEGTELFEISLEYFLRKIDNSILEYRDDSAKLEQETNERVEKMKKFASSWFGLPPVQNTDDINTNKNSNKNWLNLGRRIIYVDEQINAYKKKLAELEKERDELSIAMLKPDILQSICTCITQPLDGVTSIQEVAKNLGFNCNVLVTFLTQLDVIYFEGKIPIPSDDAFENDYLRSVGLFFPCDLSLVNIYVTPKGVDYISSLLKEYNVPQ